jgi:hypothetical protein
MSKDDVKKEKDESQGRRHFIRNGLAAAAGLTYGFTVIKDAVAQTYKVQPKVQPETLKVQPGGLKTQPRIPENFTPSLQRKRQLAEQIAPTLENILNDAGVKLSPKELSGLKQGLVERGTIRIPAAGSRADHTVSVTGTVNYD